MKMMTLIIFSLMMVMILNLVFFAIQNKLLFYKEEKTAFECGFSPKEDFSMSFSINYFFITLIFLIFDLEILMLAPMFLFYLSFVSVSNMLIIIMFFSMILVMEWMNNMLEWQY